MAMNLGPSLGSSDEDEVMGTINTTPLVDVMLVLLIIFLITIPVVTTSIKVDLPKEANVVRETKPENVIISVNKAGQIFLYDTPVKNPIDLLERMKKFAAMKPQPEVQIRGDAQSDFESVGRVMYAVQRAGITKVGFITEPAP
ncbi:ExbD/TolR family protein [Limnohabitans parvus]|uniref:Biopolymer transporter ExbD n=1 Tax=Limnohabitans parvus II-B4 TaxID=1293052 RepID=A0A315E9C2_9BURK|nr:biopolymer transporter ExbD [Limnohabitans parvus]PUE54536.1 biopolymer transporter ExbD [Limnohabitans parvus II-B4]